MMEQTNKPKFCEECNGPRKGRGWIHKDGCSKKSPVFQKTQRACSKCGGSALGRGFRHTESCCQRKTKAIKTTL